MGKYPNYQQYLEFLQQRDAGALMVLLVVVTCLSFLINARYLWPKLLPVAHNGLLVVYYVTLAIMVVRQVING